jgi:alpha-L-fucosidase
LSQDKISPAPAALLAAVFLIVHPPAFGASPAQAQSALNPAAADKETDPLVLRKLEWFQDLKFGLMMHWGPYSQWGVVESWTLCSEDEPWCRRTIPDYCEYKRRYEALPKTFNPVKFAPEKWAAAAARAGMRYVVFTTKHHDGFCMFDTRQTDYKITSADCPFHTNPDADVTRAIFDAFRAKDFGVGAYFSKPDWHSPDYWAPEWATPDRNVNYRVDRYPERWERFKAYTRRQIEELMTGYGPVDILWLDGGWVSPANGQDIDMAKIAAVARAHQPGLIIADRTVGGRYENYQTPEQQIPDQPLDGPWETCMTMATQWSYRADDVYKPARDFVRTLVEVVAKGGNLLLNIGPSPEGELPPVSLERLAEIGAWLDVNGRAIYGTRPIPPYAETNIRFTSRPDGTVFAIYLAGPQEYAPPAEIALAALTPRRGTKVVLLGCPDPVRWERVGSKTVFRLPKSALKNPPGRYAWTLKFAKG